MSYRAASTRCVSLPSRQSARYRTLMVRTVYPQRTTCSRVLPGHTGRSISVHVLSFFYDQETDEELIMLMSSMSWLQSGQEGGLMRSLSSRVKLLPEVVTSAVVVESAARFKDDFVVQLLHPQSAVNHLLSHSNACHYLVHVLIR